MRGPVRKIILFALGPLLFLAACGGGGSDLTSGGTGTGTGTGSGTGSGPGTGQTIAVANGTNAITMTVDPGPSGGQANIPYVNVTICAPGSTTNCQIIDHMEVDTGSYGVRVISSVLNSTLLAALTQETVPAGNLVECTMFADGYSWGSMHLADITVGTEKAANQSIQVIGDPNYPTIPSACSNTGPPEDDVAHFGANGIIGVGPFMTDCGDCTDSTESGDYWACPSGGGSCNPTTVTTVAQEASNPVAAFPTDNTGVILELPTVPDTGAAVATGVLVFGVGTESNNGLGSATVLTTDNQGFINTIFNNKTYPQGFIDSGSNLNFFNDDSIAKCGTSSVVFCPNSELSLSATEQGLNNATVTVNFKVGNAQTLLSNHDLTAFDNVGAPFSATTQAEDFDFGLPFFYGRNVFIVIEGKGTSGGIGPYFAF